MCFTCVNLLGKTDTPIDFIINGQGVCVNHIDVAVAEPGAVAVVIGRKNPLSPARSAELSVKIQGR